MATCAEGSAASERVRHQFVWGGKVMVSRQTLADLRTAFFTRLSEWQSAVILLLWGGALLLPDQMFIHDDWTAFRLLFREESLGTLFVMGGAFRLLVLAANGAWRPMYHLRAWMAMSSAVIWFSILLGFLSRGTIGTWLAVYPVLFAFDVVNVYRAMGDAARVDLAANRSRANGTAG
jgi:hypothetical protein